MRWLGPALVVGAFAVLAVLERRRPLRRTVEPQLQHEMRNLAVAGLSGLALRLTEKPLVGRLARTAALRRWGVSQRLPLPLLLRGATALLLLDYTLYLWHVLTHKVPLLWRFHLIHHIDRDLSASTALRFHFGEMMLSVPWRAAQVVVIGVGPRTLAIWQTATLIEILFHHSNLRLPRGVEQWLCRLIVTPRMHGIHHSMRRQETSSNWSSGLSVWDWLHGTLRLDVPQRAITIGVPAYPDAAEMALPKLLALPFGAQRPSWRPWRAGTGTLPCAA